MSQPRYLATTALLLLAGAAHAQLFTMNEACRDQVASAEALSDAGQHEEALAAFNALVTECDTRDGEEAVQVGRAHALNGMGQHEQAVEAAEAALEVSEGTSLSGLFERAYAYEKTGRMDAATADYNRIIELTEKNQNVAERATIYAKVSELNFRAGKGAEADQYLAKAMELDPGNPDLYVIRGDYAVERGDYAGAFADYDRAVEMGRTGAGMYEIRSEARLKQMQDKYGTTNAGELRAKMTPEETALVCAETTRAIELGLRNMQLDMFSALVCR
ncbi:MAG: tetratricopeptide repeat protein [Gammaproteobacteria bacterium]